MIWKPEDLLVNFAQTCHRGKETVTVATKMKNGIPGPQFRPGDFFYSDVEKFDVFKLIRPSV